MSGRNVEIIRSHYKAAAAGDARILSWLRQPIAVIDDSAGNPLRLSEPIEEPRWQPERFVALDGRVLVRVKLSGRARKTGAEVETRIAHLWTIRQGRSLRLAVYRDWESGLEAAGVQE